MWAPIKSLLNIIALLATLLVRDSHFVDAGESKIDPKVTKLLAEGKKVNIVVSFAAGVKGAVEKAKSLRHANRQHQNQAIVDALQENVKTTQASVLERLTTSTRSAGNDYAYYKQYWLSNQLFVKEATGEVINEIAADPSVLRIKKEPFAMIPTLEDEDQEELSNVNVKFEHAERENWGVAHIQAPEAWKEIGNRGEGVIVGTIDTGVRHTHELLRDNFVGVEYGWYQAVDKSPMPSDSHGHGTGTTSLLAGKRVGVAPGAKWMTCGANDGKGYFPGEALLDCIQWMACPTLPDGSKPDCSKAPHIVSNSWITENGEDGYNEGILNWRELGIIPVFGIGNKQFWCNTTYPPANLPFVIGVGSFTSGNSHCATSSVGPAPDGRIKPDIVAPGWGVEFAGHESDTETLGKTGTSFATPHVAGVVALLKVRQPELTYEDAYNLIMQNTDKNIILLPRKKKIYCNLSLEEVFPRMTIFPNIYVGYGRVDVLRAVQAQTVLLNKTK